MSFHIIFCINYSWFCLTISVSPSPYPSPCLVFYSIILIFWIIWSLSSLLHYSLSSIFDSLFIALCFIFSFCIIDFLVPILYYLFNNFSVFIFSVFISLLILYFLFAFFILGFMYVIIFSVFFSQLLFWSILLTHIVQNICYVSSGVYHFYHHTYEKFSS